MVILLRDLKRPECLFGWRLPAVEPGVFENDDLFIYEIVKDAAETHALITRSGLEGSLLAIGHGLRRECSSEGISWF